MSKPIVEEINKLPERLRDYIHDLETNQEVFALRENQRILETRIKQLERKLGLWEDSNGTLSY